MAARALMTAACSNEDNEIAQQPQMARGIPFTATISMGESAATRALTEDNQNNKIVAKWVTGEKVALIYKVGTTLCKTDAEVTAQNNKTATLSAELQSGAQNGSDVTIIYPASAADIDATTNGYIKTDLLEGQDGTLTGTNKSIDKTCDLRKADGKLSIKDGKATVYDGTPGTLVKLKEQYSIFKFTITDIAGDNSLSATEFKVSDAFGNAKATFTNTTAASELFVALPELEMEAGTYWFNATIGGKPYVAKATIATTATVAGKFYKTEVKMATVGDVILLTSVPNETKNTFAFGPAGMSDFDAVITYVAKPSDVTTTNHNHGLAMARNDETRQTGTVEWEYAKPLILSTVTNKTPVRDASWMLPTKDQWNDMNNAVGGTATDLTNLKTLGNFTGDFYWTSTVKVMGAEEQASDPWYIVSFLQNSLEGWNNVYKDVSIRLGLAF